MPMKAAHMQKGTEKRWARSHARDRPTDQVVMITSIEIRLPIGHASGSVHRPIFSSPTRSRKSWDWMVEKMMRLLTATEITVRVASLDSPKTRGKSLSGNVQGGWMNYVERTSCYHGGACIEGTIKPRVADVAREPVRVKMEFVVRQASQRKRNGVPFRPLPRGEAKA